MGASKPAVACCVLRGEMEHGTRSTITIGLFTPTCIRGPISLHRRSIFSHRPAKIGYPMLDAQLTALQAEAAAAFLLDEAGVTALCQDLHARVLALGAGEGEAVAALRDAVK